MIALLWTFLQAGRLLQAEEILIGDTIRVQALSPTLVRIESRDKKRTGGFVDQPTFAVVERRWPGAALVKDDKTGRIIFAGKYQIDVTQAGLRLLTMGGEKVWRPGRPRSGPFPAPKQLGKVFVFRDDPQILPPQWGATPPREDQIEELGELKATGGWRLHAGSSDYLFLADEGYEAVRKEYLRLTGRIPMLPLWAYGFWTCRFHPYSEETALKSIDRFRALGVPLDVFVLDTDWRVGGSTGYEVETRYFPDPRRFFEQAHSRHVHIGFNDHPDDRKELKHPTYLQGIRYTYDGLSKILNLGLDWWWYDPHWRGTGVVTPLREIGTHRWLQRLFWETRERVRPGERPLIMAMSGNADHRYPVWWTGDNMWHSLPEDQEAIVDHGIRLRPYVNADLGGHHGPPLKAKDDDALAPGDFEAPAGVSRGMVRWMQFGCFSPITRTHGDYRSVRYPWAYGPEAQRLITEYIKLRYRLLPTLYAAARRIHDDGTPLLRRCDLEWPQYEEAADPTQYLFGDDLLIAPYTRKPLPLPARLLWTPEGKPGLKAEYFENPRLEGTPKLVRIDPEIQFDWGARAPAKGMAADYSIRWTGKLGPMPETARYDIAPQAAGAFLKLAVQGKVIWDSEQEYQADFWDGGGIDLTKGRTYDIELELRKDPNRTEEPTTLAVWWLPHYQVDARGLWVPPGQWEDVFSGELLEGPRTVEIAVPIWKLPIYVRRGGLVLTAPQEQWTGQNPWDPVIVDAYPASSGLVRRQLYEDDGSTTAYLKEGFAVTKLDLEREGKRIILRLHATEGTFGGQRVERGWVTRLHLRPADEVAALRVDGRVLLPGEAKIAGTSATVLAGRTEAGGQDAPMPFRGPGTAPPAGAGVVVEFHLRPEDIHRPHEIQVLIR